jgi:hypothetical protein
MLHASMKRLGWVISSPKVNIHALLALLGEHGTLMMYVVWEDSPHTMEAWSEKVKRAYRKECPLYNPRHVRRDGKVSPIKHLSRTPFLFFLVGLLFLTSGAVQIVYAFYTI